MMEIWKPIKGYEELYQVSNKGRVKSLDRYIGHRFEGKLRKHKGRVLKPSLWSGYRIVNLVKDKKRKTFQIHRLVAQAFLKNPDKLPVVHHKDSNTLNNTVENLQWCTTRENVFFAKDNMKKRKDTTKSNTGERYIHYRKKHNSYEVTVDKKYYGKFKSLEEAIKIRDGVIRNE